MILTRTETNCYRINAVDKVLLKNSDFVSSCMKAFTFPAIQHMPCLVIIFSTNDSPSGWSMKKYMRNGYGVTYEARMSFALTLSIPASLFQPQYLVISFSFVDKTL